MTDEERQRVNEVVEKIQGAAKMLECAAMSIETLAADEVFAESEDDLEVFEGELAGAQEQLKVVRDQVETYRRITEGAR